MYKRDIFRDRDIGKGWGRGGGGWVCRVDRGDGRTS